MAKLRDFVKIQGKEVDLIIQEVALMLLYSYQLIREGKNQKCSKLS
ncbi:hypothetical protein ES705_22058 [subsurface metagenome]